MQRAAASPVRTGAPPWLWFWFALAVIKLPALGESWRTITDDLLPLGTLARSVVLQRLGDAEAGATLLFGFTTTVRVGLPIAVILPGLLVVGLPWLRGWWVERQFGLVTSSRATPALTEIAQFLQANAPELEIRVNLRRAHGLAFVYPTGYRRARVALLGGLIRLWRANRRAAEAVLLHEIVHARRGDALLLGVGSPFERIVKYSTLIVFAPYLILLIAANHVFNWQTLIILAMHAPFLIISIIVLPLSAIWSAELNADYLTLAQQPTGDGVQQALGSQSGTRHLWCWLLFRLSHPPNSMRYWTLRHQATLGLHWLLLLFPVAFLVQLVALQGYALTGYIGSGFAPDDIWRRSVVNTQYFLQGAWYQWLGMGVILLFWPMLSTCWESIFHGHRLILKHTFCRSYAISAFYCVLLAILAFILINIQL